MRKLKNLMVQGEKISLITQGKDDFISLTDMVKNFGDETILYNWLRNRNTLEFLGIWEQLYNPNFKPLEFERFKKEAGLHRFSLSPKKWIDATNAIGIISKAGRYGGGTYAHKDIAFEFGSWLSPEFKLYLIKEFQRLKDDENERKSLGWDIKRNLAKINYKVHTDAVKEHLIPPKISAKHQAFIYASEADVLNKALFGVTAQEWKEQNPKLEGNIRDHALASQLVCLAGLESINAEFIRQGISQAERLLRLNEIAIIQMKSLLNNPGIRRLGE